MTENISQVMANTAADAKQLEFLYELNPRIKPHQLQTETTDDIVLAWLKTKPSVYEVTSLVSNSTSSVILTKLAKEDKRKKVHDELMTNPHTPGDCLVALLARTIENLDLAHYNKLSNSFLDKQTDANIILLAEEILKHDKLDRFLSSKFMMSLSRIGTSESFEIGVKLHGKITYAKNYFLGLLLDGVVREEKCNVSAERVLEVLEANPTWEPAADPNAEYRYSYSPNRSGEVALGRLATFVASSPKEIQQKFLNMAPASFQRRFLTLSAEGKTAFTALEVLAGSSLAFNQQTVDIMASGAHKELIRPEILKYFAGQGIDLLKGLYDAHMSVECKLILLENFKGGSYLNDRQYEIRRVLSSIDNNRTLADLLLRVPNFCGYVPYQPWGLSDITYLLENGFPERECMKMLTRVDKALIGNHPLITDMMFRNKMVMDVPALEKMSDEQLEQLIESLASDSASWVTSNLSSQVCTLLRIEREVVARNRKVLIGLLDDHQLWTFLDRYCDPGGLMPGELLPLIEAEDYLSFRLIEIINKRGGLEGHHGWTEEVLLRIPRDWKYTPARLLSLARDAFFEAFGTNKSDWETALGLLQGWEGTLQDLIDATKAV